MPSVERCWVIYAQQAPIRDQFSLEDPNHCHLCQERIRDRTRFLVGVETASA